MRNLRGYNGQKKESGNKGGIEDILRSFGVGGNSAKKYSGLSEDELIEELIKAVQKSKAEGTFDGASIQAFLQMVSPRLSPEKREKLQNVINIISVND